LALLGAVPDDELAGRMGRTEKAVVLMKIRRGIPSAEDRRRRENREKLKRRE
jgi:hypothetical protein